MYSGIEAHKSFVVERTISYGEILNLDGAEKITSGEKVTEYGRIIEIVSSAAESINTTGSREMMQFVCGYTDEQKRSFRAKYPEWTSPLLEDEDTREATEIVIGKFLVQEARRFIEMTEDQVFHLSAEEMDYYLRIIPLAKDYIMDSMYRELYLETEGRLCLRALNDRKFDFSEEDRASGNPEPEYPNLRAFINDRCKDVQTASEIQRLTGGSLTRMFSLIQNYSLPPEFVSQVEEIIIAWMTDSENPNLALEEYIVRLYEQVYVETIEKYGATVDLVMMLNGLPIDDELENQLEAIQASYDEHLPTAYKYFLGEPVQDHPKVTWSGVLQKYIINRAKRQGLESTPLDPKDLYIETDAELLKKAEESISLVKDLLPILSKTLGGYNMINITGSVYADSRAWNIDFKIPDDDRITGFRDYYVQHIRVLGLTQLEIASKFAHESMHRSEGYIREILKEKGIIPEDHKFSSTLKEFFAETMEMVVTIYGVDILGSTQQSSITELPSCNIVEVPEKIGASVNRMLINPRQLAFGKANLSMWNMIAQLREDRNNTKDDGRMKDEVVRRLVTASRAQTVEIYSRVFQSISLDPRYRGPLTELSILGDGFWYLGLPKNQLYEKLNRLSTRESLTAPNSTQEQTKSPEQDIKGKANTILNKRFAKNESTSWLLSEEAQLVWFGMMVYAFTNDDIDGLLSYLDNTDPITAKNSLIELGLYPFKQDTV